MPQSLAIHHPGQNLFSLSRMSTKCLRIFWLPIITYAIFFGFLFFGKPPVSDLTGMHAVMGATFIIFGCSICYLMSILPHWVPFESQDRMKSHFWTLSAMFFYLLWGDASFRIHENLGRFVGDQAIVFIIYGGILMILVFAYRQSFHKPFWLFLGSFIFLSGIAVLSDSPFFPESFFVIGGELRSHEQFCETLSVLFLSSGFASEAIHDLVTALKAR